MILLRLLYLLCIISLLFYFLVRVVYLYSFVSLSFPVILLHMVDSVTRSVAQSPVLFSTTRGNMNNISSCLVKSTYVAFIVLIVNDHSLHRTRLLRVTWHPNAFFDSHPFHLPQQYMFQPMVIPPVPPATMFTHSNRLS